MKKIVKKNLRLYKREVVVYAHQGKYRKAVYVPETQYVLTDDVVPFNKGKRIKFTEVKLDYNYKKINELIAKYGVNIVQKYTKQLSDKELYWRKSASKFGR